MGMSDTLLKERIRELLRELVDIRGVSGFEQDIAWAISAKLGEVADDVCIDNMGNVYAVKDGGLPGPTIMLAAHADSVGGIVTEILGNGLVRFQPVGLVSLSSLPSTRVWVGKTRGVIGAVPGHFKSGSDGTSTSSAFSVDVGASNSTEVKAFGIDVGSPVSFAGSLVELGNPDRLCSQYVDDRIGCALLLLLLRDIAHERFAGKVNVAITVREETNMAGARIAATRLEPDCAIAVDTVPASDTLPGGSGKFGLGLGPVIQLGEGVQGAFVGTMAHPGMKDAILRSASAQGIQVQLSAEVGRWTTDAAAIHASGCGIPTGFVSVPRRYAHSPNEVMDLNDAASALKILKGVVLSLGNLDLRFVKR